MIKIKRYKFSFSINITFSLYRFLYRNIATPILTPRCIFTSKIQIDITKWNQSSINFYITISTRDYFLTCTIILIPHPRCIPGVNIPRCKYLTSCRGKKHLFSFFLLFSKTINIHPNASKKISPRTNKRPYLLPPPLPFKWRATTKREQNLAKRKKLEDSSSFHVKNPRSPHPRALCVFSRGWSRHRWLHGRRKPRAEEIPLPPRKNVP